MSELIVIELIRLIPSLLWLVLVVILIGVFYKPIKEELLPRMSGIRAWGLEVELLRMDLDKAVDKQGAEVGQSERTRVLRRAERSSGKLRRARILWIDDYPQNNEYERRMMRALGALVDTARDSLEARSLMARTGYDLVISDIDRSGIPDEGLRFLEDSARKPRTLVSFSMLAGSMRIGVCLRTPLASRIALMSYFTW
ncbi:MAG TPA: hypothetical protein VMW79_03745 [Anaerolineae bacterium]|nr:hypothetical protein [Anaerolineae bacterium]